MIHFTSTAYIVSYEQPVGFGSRSYRVAGICNTPKRAADKAGKLHTKLNGGKHLFTAGKLDSGPCPVKVTPIGLDDDVELFAFNY